MRRENQAQRCTNRRSASLILMFCTSLVNPGCSKDDPADIAALVKETQPTGVKILLVGIDGATFDILKPLVQEGRLPTFKRLLEKGSHGILKSETPMFSPAIWTSVMTGKPRSEHNILEFIDRTTNTLVSSRERHAAALWNIVSPFPVKCGFIGFWATWPAEAVNGWMISDRVASDRWTEWTDRHETEALTYPADLIHELRPLVMDPAQPPWFEIDQLVSLTPEETEELRALKKPIFGHGPSVFNHAYCAQRSYEEIALHMLKKAGQPDLMGVFLIANDPICHTFWHFWQPEKFQGVDRSKAERLGKLVPNFYVHNDRYLTKLLSKIDSDTVVIIVSDHGFEASGELPKPRTAESWELRREAALAVGQVAVGQSGQHHIDGVFIACGGPIVAGGTTTASIEDVAPTILALLGLPVARDMGGRVLKEVIDPAFLKAHPIRSIASYESYIKRKGPEDVDLGSDPEMLERLKSLGYIGENEGTGEAASQPAEQTTGGSPTP